MQKRALLVIFLIVFLDLVGFGIVIPILPYYAQKYGAAGQEVGALMAVYSLMQFLFAPFWGRISDRVGRRPILLMSILGSVFSMTLLGFADSLTWLFIGRTLAGVFGANISTAYAYIADVTTEQNRAKGMGIIGAGFGLGFIFGPAIGGMLSVHGYNVPMFAGAALAALNLLLAWFFLAEPALDPQARAANRNRRSGLKETVAILGRPATGTPILIFFLTTFAVVQMEVVFALFMKERYAFDARQAGMLLGATGLVMVLMQGGLIGRLAKRYGEVRLIRSGAVISGIALGVFAVTHSISIAVAALILMAVGHGMLHPSLSSLVSRGAASMERGAVMGTFHAASSLARIVGPIVAGLFYDGVGIASPFAVAAAVFIFLFLFSLRVFAPGAAGTARVAPRGAPAR